MSKSKKKSVFKINDNDGNEVDEDDHEERLQFLDNILKKAGEIQDKEDLKKEELNQSIDNLIFEGSP